MSNEQITTLKIPQMGEGLRQVKITKFLKQPGDLVREDEVIYEMETNKSAVEIESPFTGYLEKWLATEHQIVDVGSNIATIKLKETHIQVTKYPNCTQNKELDSIELESDKFSISPRILRYCFKKGVDDNEINLIPRKGKILSMQDVDKYVSSKAEGENIKTFSPQQNSLIKNFRNSESQIIASSTISILDIKCLKDKREKLIQENQKSLGNISVTDFQVFAYVVAGLSRKFSKLRTRVISDTHFIEDKELNLGIATQSLNKELNISVLESCSNSSFDVFIFQFYEKISTTISGKNDAIHPPHIILSYLGSESKILCGSPLLVYPSIATIFLGGTQKDGTAYISVTFDHRIINGSDVEEVINKFLHELTR